MVLTKFLLNFQLLSVMRSCYFSFLQMTMTIALYRMRLFKHHVTISCCVAVVC